MSARPRRERCSRAEEWGRLTLRQAIWLLPCALAIHELEEWNIVPWFHAHFSPPTPLTERAARLGLVVVGLTGFVSTGLAFLLPNTRATLLVLLPLFGFVAFGNALQHGFWWIHFGTYAPGAATALLGVTPAMLYVSWRAYKEGEVSGRFVVAPFVLALIPFASAVAVGSILLPEHIAMHSFFVRLADWLWGAT